MPSDPTQSNESADEIMARADGEDTEGHFRAQLADGSENDSAGFRAAWADGKESEDGKEGFRAL